MAHKKGQMAGNAAAFVAILTVLIILYILFLPPDIRTELLGDENAILGNDTETSSGTEVLLKQSVGQVTYINTDEKTYDIPTTRIYSPTSGQVLKAITSFSIRYALFDNENSKYTTEFNIERDATKNVLLSFNVRNQRGPVTITLNGREIFNGEITTTSPKPISLDHGDLLDSNTLVFSVPSPGIRFWSANKYSIESLQITGDVTDYSNSMGIQNFIISKAEKENLESLKLYFYPVCTISDVGSLKIEFNGEAVYNGIADCGTKTFTALDVSKALVGSNELRFYSSKGSYTLDNMYVKTTMSEPAYKTYYFDVDPDYFNVKDSKADCGDYDGICPSGCDDIEDADCCFKRSGFWCALPTSNENDRCRYYVASDNCGTCKTGYYDRSGDAPENCEDVCGDNNDDTCASGCSQPNKYYDKDCCFAQSSDNYWCQETPITGIADKCKPEVTPGDCDLCPSGYENEDGDSPDACDADNFNSNDEDYVLSNDYELKLTVRFTDATDRKRVDFNINGHTFRIDTTGAEYTKVISDYANEDTNSIEIIPVSEDINIAELKVELKQVK